jgi:hypothetical protein
MGKNELPVLNEGHGGAPLKAPFEDPPPPAPSARSHDAKRRTSQRERRTNRHPPTQAQFPPIFPNVSPWRPDSPVEYANYQRISADNPRIQQNHHHKICHYIQAEMRTEGPQRKCTH